MTFAHLEEGDTLRPDRKMAASLDLLPQRERDPVRKNRDQAIARYYLSKQACYRGQVVASISRVVERMVIHDLLMNERADSERGAPH